MPVELNGYWGWYRIGNIDYCVLVNEVQRLGRTERSSVHRRSSGSNKTAGIIMTALRLSSPRCLTASMFGLVLLFTVVGSGQTTTAQIPTLDKDEPMSTLEDAIRTADSDSQLVSLAAALLDAREETEISYSTFKEGMWRFRQLGSRVRGPVAVH